jgi:hypothetical protein
MARRCISLDGCDFLEASKVFESVLADIDLLSLISEKY